MASAQPQSLGAATSSAAKPGTLSPGPTAVSQAPLCLLGSSPHAVTSHDGSAGIASHSVARSARQTCSGGAGMCRAWVSMYGRACNGQ